MCVCIAMCTTVANNTAQNRLDNFPSYPLDNHHCYDDVYFREGHYRCCCCYYYYYYYYYFYHRFTAIIKDNLC